MRLGLRSVVTVLLVCLAVSPVGFCQYDGLVGKETRLMSSDGRVVVRGGFDRASFNAYISSRMIDDSENALALEMAHKIIVVDSGTRVSIMEINSLQGCVRVKVLEGLSKGATGWILLNEIDKDNVEPPAPEITK
jgi:hypothetical protein